MQLKPADAEDPVALKTGRAPLEPGGANFRTHDGEAMLDAPEQRAAALDLPLWQAGY
jgi:hypothetical protein